MLDQPLYTEVSNESGGGDPLGTAPISEMLYRTTFPGINNVVRYIRVYSAICWTVRQIDLAAGRDHSANVAELSVAGLEKIQLLLSWHNSFHGVQGLPGASRKTPIDDTPVVLNFQSMPGRNDARQQELASDFVPGDGAYFMQAVSYRPSIVNGLAFLETTNVPNAYKLTAAGEALANAYESNIAEHPWREWLADPIEITATRTQVLFEMDDMLDLLKPSKAEQRAFLDQFYPENDDTAIGPNWMNRRWGITLALRALEAEEPFALASGKPGVSIEDVRYTMARGTATDGTPLDLTGIAEIQGLWSGLQLRQYSRAALDTLFRHTESWIQDAVALNKPRDILDCANGIGALLVTALPETHRVTVGSLFEEMSNWTGTHDSLYAASSELLPEQRLESLNTMLLDKSWFAARSADEVLALRDAYIALVFCAVEAKNLRQNPHVIQQFANDRVSLSKLTLLVEAHLNSTPSEFIAHVIQYLVILQHFTVVQERSGDGRNRFRFLKGDRGLERITTESGLFEMSVLADRLEHAMALLAQCSILKATGPRQYVLTREGRRRLTAAL